jgi:hypothetical protein
MSFTKLASLVGLVFVSIFPIGVAQGGGRISSVTPVSMGEFCGIPYVKFRGLFEGDTGGSGQSSYRVPFVIRTPVDPNQGNGVTLYEYPHFVTGDFSRIVLGYDLLFCMGFSQASVGYSNLPEDGNSILDHSVAGVIVKGGTGRDVFIMADFAAALEKRGAGGALLGNNSRRRYLIGFSNSSTPLATLLDSGKAEGLFQFALPFTTDGFNDDFTRSLKDALADRRFTGKVIVVNSELDELFSGGPLHDDNPQIRDRYRYYFTAGAAHIPETFNCDSEPAAQVPLNHASPATFIPELRARFIQGHRWATSKSVKHGPPASTQLGDPAYDEAGNALVVNINGVSQPRLPFVELGEATFRFFNEVFPEPFSFLIGSITDLISVTDLGFADFADYQKTFEMAAKDYRHSGAMLEEDEEFFLDRAAALPPNTLTQNFVSNYEDVYVGPNRPDCRDLP